MLMLLRPVFKSFLKKKKIRQRNVISLVQSYGTLKFYYTLIVLISPWARAGSRYH